MFEELIESAAQKEKFRVAANKLLNQCFLLILRILYVEKRKELGTFTEEVTVLYGRDQREV